MVNEEKYHLINDYLRGELKGRALDSFKAELNQNKELQEAVQLQASIIKQLELAREKELKAYIQKNVSRKGGLSLTPVLRIALASAAAIVLLATAFIIFQNINQSQEQEMVQEQPAAQKKKEVVKSLPKDQEKKVTEIDSQTLAIENIEPPQLEEVEEDLESEEVLSDEDVKDAMRPSADVEAMEEPDNEDIEPAVDIASNSTAGTPDNPLKDELLGSKQFMVNTLVTLIEEESLEVKSSTKQAKRGYEDYEQASEKTQEIAASRSINVEYWKPVINSRVYLYDGKTVKLYGIENQTPLDFKELDNRLYVELNRKHYYLEKNSKHNRLVEVTNPTLLKVLND